MGEIQLLWLRLEKALDDLQDRVTEGDPLQVALQSGYASSIWSRLHCETLGHHGETWGDLDEEYDTPCKWCNQ